MQVVDFKEGKCGRLVCDPTGYWFFVPDPLPPALDPSWSLGASLSEADRRLGELSGLAKHLPNPHLLIAPFVRREAVLSSRIEGTQASLSDLFMFEVAKTYEGAADVREVSNYVRAMEYGLARMNEFPLSLRLIREVHQRLLENVRGQHLMPGEFRTSQNWLGPPGCTLDDAAFVPPRPPEMREALDSFEKYLYAESPLPALVRLALIHYQFEAIHPFLDGNGRVGRLLILLLLCRDGLLPEPFLNLSAFFERHRDNYYRLLLSVSQSGDWVSWIDFFLKGVKEQSADAIRRTNELLDLWRSHRARLEAVRSSVLPQRLVDLLFRLPVITIARVAAELDVTHRSAALNVRKLCEAGILEEGSHRKRNKLYVARAILEIVERR